jgi:hypothetical protein
LRARKKIDLGRVRAGDEIAVLPMCVHQHADPLIDIGFGSLNHQRRTR